MSDTIVFPDTGGTGERTVPNKGEIIVGDGTGIYGVLGIGSNTQVLTLDSSQPLGVKWAAASGGVASVSGTTNRITSTGGNTPVIDISASYVGQASITTLGTITTGTWNATTIAINHGGSGQTTANAALNAFLPSQGGNSGKFLTTDGSNSSWASGGSSPLTTKGDLFGYSSVDARIPVGSDGKVLTADSGNALGVSWQPVTATAGGIDTNIQVNVSGSIGAFGDFTYTESSGTLSIGGTIQPGTLTISPSAGSSGRIVFPGGSSGAVTYTVPAAAGGSTFTLPVTDGSLGYPLITDGSGHLTFALLPVDAIGSGTGNITEWNNNANYAAQSYVTIANAENNDGITPIADNTYTFNTGGGNTQIQITTVKGIITAISIS